MLPAIAAKAVPMPKATAAICPAFTPESIAASRFWVTARIAFPRKVRRRTRFSPTSERMLTPKTRICGTPNRPPRNGTDSMVYGVRIDCVSPPQMA